MSAPERPTLVSLANQLGVSRQTVSNAINRPETVAPDTLARVLEAIERSNYRPSRVARQLRTKSAQTLAVRIMPEFDGISGHILNQFNHQLAKSAGDRGYRMITFFARDDRQEVEQYKDMYDAGEIDGAIISGTTHTDIRPSMLLDMDIPFVSFGRPWGQYDDGRHAPFPWVDVDCKAGTREATQALIEAGHTRIGYLSWPIVPGIGRDRYEGWTTAMGAAGLPAEGLVEISEDNTFEASISAQNLMRAGATAIVCASDSLALGAMPVCREDKVVVIGFDDTPVARALGMNSVAQPIEKAAIDAFNMLHSRVKETAANRHALLTPQLMLRNRLDAEPVT